MKTIVLPWKAAVLAAALWLAGTPVFAQNPPSTPAARRPEKSANENAPRANTGLPFEIEITDGMFIHKGRKLTATLENVVDMLRDRHSGANIVISPGIPEFEIRNLKLRATSLEQELDALRVASGMQFTWSTGGLPFGTLDPATGQPVGPYGQPLVAPPPVAAIDPVTGQPVTPPTSATNAPLYILSETSSRAEIKSRVEVFNLSHLLGDDSVENRQEAAARFINQVEHIVVSTLKTYNQSSGKPVETPTFKFHPGANLLVVVGPDYPLAVTRKVLDTLSVTEAGPLVSKIFRLRYTTPDSVLTPVANAITDKRSKVDTDNRTGSIIVLATEAEIERITNILQNLDVPADNPPPAGGTDRRR